MKIYNLKGGPVFGGLTNITTIYMNNTIYYYAGQNTNARRRKETYAGIPYIITQYCYMCIKYRNEAR